MIKIYFTAALIFMVLFAASAQQAGTLDSTFGTDGFSYGSITDNAQFGDLKLLSDGKIIVVGSTETGYDYNVHLLRLNADGTIDNTFGTEGEVVDNDPAYSDVIFHAGLQQDQKLLVATNPNGFASVIRYNTDGTRDTTFGSDGRAKILFPNAQTTGVEEVNQLTNGKIIISGNALRTNPLVYFAFVSRLNADGSIDTTFGVDGFGLAPVNFNDFCEKILPDGKILLGGRTATFAVARMNSDGTIDSTFGTNGMVTSTFTPQITWIFSVNVTTDGSIIGMGAAYTTNLLLYNYVAARYSADGVLDSTFGVNGIAADSVPGKFLSLPMAGTLQADNKIVFTGESADTVISPNFTLLRMNADGSRDTAFGTGGIVISVFPPTTTSYPTAVVIDPSNKIIVGGRINYGLGAARYQGGVISGIKPVSTASLIMAYPNPAHDAVTIDFTSLTAQPQMVSVKNIFGSTVKSFLLNEGNNMHRVNLDVHDLTAGIYFIEMHTANGTQSAAFVKE